MSGFASSIAITRKEYPSATGRGGDKDAEAIYLRQEDAKEASESVSRQDSSNSHLRLMFGSIKSQRSGIRLR